MFVTSLGQTIGESGVSALFFDQVGKEGLLYLRRRQLKVCGCFVHNSFAVGGSEQIAAGRHRPPLRRVARRDRTVAGSDGY